MIDKVDKVIGIVSYLPDGELRNIRINRLESLINKLYEVFPNIPITIIAQNWKDYKIEGVTALYYPKLGVLGARKKLREYFLNSTYEWLIMLDDDCEMVGDRIDGDDYLSSLTIPNAYARLNPVFKLFAIHRELYDKYPLVDIDYENDEGYEDHAYMMLLERVGANRIPVHSKLRDISNSCSDPHSTLAKDKDTLVLLNRTINKVNTMRELR